ncbi:MAG: hypothetical protein MK193_03925 [Lentisphaeria bacterium]|nr:hypothetical protein [Lentisphaeria bacterium]
MKLLEKLGTEVVIVELDCRIHYIGTLENFDKQFLSLKDVTICDESTIKVSAEEFFYEVKLGAAVVSRKSILINRKHIIAISKLDDFLEL